MKSLTAVRWLPGQMAWKRLSGWVRKLVLRVLLMLGELIPTVPARWVADLWFSVPPPRGTEAEWPAGTPFEVESQGLCDPWTSLG